MINPLLRQLAQNVVWTGGIRTDMMAFLQYHDCAQTADHCLNVGAKARELAEQFHVIPNRAEPGGWLHDISAVIPRAQQVEAAHELGLEVLPEEMRAPILLHQKISAVIASELFQITDARILSAIGCHTTLKPGAATLDKIVFLADKIAWDQPMSPPYLKDMQHALDHLHSLDDAIYIYCDYLWKHRDEQFVAHPWFLEVYHSMAQMNKE